MAVSIVLCLELEQNLKIELLRDNFVKFYFAGEG